VTTRSGYGERAAQVGTRAREFDGKLRRMVVTRTRSALYQVTGHLLLDGSTETRDAEVFAGVGFASRPSEDADTEAVVAFLGPGQPVIVAMRQEAIRRAIAADLAANETQLHNATTLIRIKANGTVEIRTSGGVAHRLAKASELAALAEDFYGHGHPSTGAGPIPTFTPPDPPGDPLANPGFPGTEVLRGE
jgi:hypothetical protein